MTDKKKISYFDKPEQELPANFPTNNPVSDPEPKPVVIAPKKPKVYYTEVSWKGVKTVYRCSVCSTDRDEKDVIILHLLTHVPENERVELLEKLMEA